MGAGDEKQLYPIGLYRYTRTPIFVVCSMLACYNSMLACYNSMLACYNSMPLLMSWRQGLHKHFFDGRSVVLRPQKHHDPALCHKPWQCQESGKPHEQRIAAYCSIPCIFSNQEHKCMQTMKNHFGPRLNKQAY